MRRFCRVGANPLNSYLRLSKNTHFVVGSTQMRPYPKLTNQNSTNNYILFFCHTSHKNMVTNIGLKSLSIHLQMKCIASHNTMAHSLAPRLPSSSISTSPKKNAHLPSCLCFHKVLSCQQTSAEGLGQKLITRRSVALGLGGAVLGLKAGEGSGNAAARRPPPPPVEEKKDPNVSGVMAKVLASKRRKEAMKESMAKLRERGKAIVQIQEPSSE